MKTFCPTCEEYRETKAVSKKVKHVVRGQEIAVAAKVTACAACGENLGGDEADQEVLSAVYAEYRRLHGLLSPEEIKGIRARYCLSQKSFAALLGMSEATINRYEQGGLQDPSHETAMRACEDPAFVRTLLKRRGHLLSPRQQTQTKEALDGTTSPGNRWFDVVRLLDLSSMSDEVSDRTGFRRFEYQRFASVVTWFCCEFGEVSRTVINKLLFYADFLNFKTDTVSLTGTPYRRLGYGPVPADYGCLLDRMEAEGLVTCREVAFQKGQTGYYYALGPAARELHVEFTPHELEVLGHVAKTFKGVTAKAISARSHREAAWKDTEEKQLISYQKAATLSLDL